VVWEAEHHFLEEYSHSSAPEMFLAAASQRTKRIRLGHGIVQVPTNHPMRIAERAGTLDILSDGRLELGLGEGQLTQELKPFGATLEDKRERFVEGVQALIPMFGDEPTEHHGKYWDLPLRNVLPKPVQKPHPPLWVACTKMNTIRDAGRWGMGVLGFQFASASQAEQWIGAYYNEFVKRPDPLADYVRNPNIAVASYFMCSPTDELALSRNEGASFFQFSLESYRSKIFADGPSLWERYGEWRETERGKQLSSYTGGLIGSPETVRRRLRKFEQSNIDMVILLVQTGKVQHEHVCASLELFGREVMPEFHEREAEHQAWKEAVLAGEITLLDPETEQLQVDGQVLPWERAKAQQVGS
jgi:alkanesulfonate monooxygenase SsuD/methylene tetrahydromethanopterin reductase-like flavin-dependent oxidoreductase (luciferase family)